MENDLISRQKLIDDLEAWRKILDRRVSRFDDMVLHTLPVVFDLVNEQKTVKAEPVRYGRWIKEKLSMCEPYYICSECGKLHHQDYNFCNNCGAKMYTKEYDHG